LTEINIGIEDAMCMNGIPILSDAWAYKMHDYACMNGLRCMMVDNLQTQLRRDRQNIGILGM